MLKDTLLLKLRVFMFRKLMTHNSALYGSTATQMPEGEVLVRLIAVLDPWDSIAWDDWCAQNNKGEGWRVDRALNQARMLTWRSSVHYKGGKRSVHKRPARSMKRTVFTSLR